MHELQTFKASRNNNFLVQPIEHDGGKQKGRWKAVPGEGCAAKFSHLQDDEDKHRTLQHGAVFTVHEAVLRVDLSRCMFLTYLLPLFSCEAHEEGCSGSAASFQRELDSLIPPAEPLQT